MGSRVLACRPDYLSVEHQAYEGLTRRRSISFVKAHDFVITDEVKGPATGRLTLRLGLGPGTVTRTAPGEYCYRDGDAGLRIVLRGPEGSRDSVDQDWYSEAMHQKALRPVLRLDVDRDGGAGVQRFVTRITPIQF